MITSALAQNPQPFPPVHLSDKDAKALTHAIGVAHFMNRTIDRRALAVFTKHHFHEAIDANEAAHALDWAMSFLDTLNPPL